jgi:hypothetical protein
MLPPAMPLFRVRAGGARGCIVVLVLLVLVAFLLGGFGARFAWRAARPLMKPAGFNEALSKLGLIPEMRAVPGDASRFDPIASYAAVRDLAGPGAQLVSMNVRFVRSDGTLDLKAAYQPGPGADYSFVREVPRPATAPPPGAGGGAGPWYEPVQVRVFEPGRRVTRTVNGSRSSFENTGMLRDPGTPTLNADKPIADPTCSMAALWKLATAGRAVPADAVASVRYQADGYSFTIADLKISAAFGPDCVRRKR